MHTGGGGGGGRGEGKYNTPLSQISKHLLGIFPESLDPPRDFGKKHQVPPPLDFQPVCIYVSS